MLSPSTWFIEQELKRRGYQTQTFDDPYLVHVAKASRSFFFHATKTLQTSALFFLCKDKYLTKQVLDVFQYPTAKYQLINRGEKTSISLSFPLAIKPLLLSGGEDIALNIQNENQISGYWQTHPQYKKLLIEEMLEGVDTRILIVRGKFFAAVQRRPAHVTGDGILSIAELIEQENVLRRRLKDQDAKEKKYTTDLELIVFDNESIRTIQESGYSENDILEKNKELFVRKNANVSMGGSSIDVTDLVCHEIRVMCENIAKDLNANTLGIDIMTEDLSQPLASNPKWGIVELNGSPGLDLHILTDEGTRRNPVPLIVDEIEEYLQKMG